MAKANRLANEMSPYLLQHAHNPVEWYPWGEEALKLAREQDKPILLPVNISISSSAFCISSAAEYFAPLIGSGCVLSVSLLSV